MKNNFITKIIGATLAFAMMIGGAVGVFSAQEAKRTDAASGDTLSIADYASSNSWVNTQAFTTVVFDSNITLTGKSNGNNSKYYSSNESWRHYEGDSGTITISTETPNLTLDSATFVYSNGNAGVLKYSSTNYNSGAAIALSGLTSAVIQVGHSSGTKNGNVQITSITVTYTISGGSSSNSSSSSSSSSSFAPVTYTVTYHDTNKTSGTVPTDSTAYESGQSVTVAGNTGNLERTGYTWSGWSVNQDGSGTAYGPNYTTTYQVGTSNINFYPIWTRNVTPLPASGTITINGNNTNLGGSYASNVVRTVEENNTPNSEFGLVFSNVVKSNNDLQFKANAGVVYSTTPLSYIRNVTVSGTDSNQAVIKYGTTPNTGCTETEVGTENTYFKVSHESSGARYWTITVEYSLEAPATLTGLSIEGGLDTVRKTYDDGESFDPTGLVINAEWDHVLDTENNVLDDVEWEPTVLTAGTTQVVGTYTFGSASKTVSVTGLTVNGPDAILDGSDNIPSGIGTNTNTNESGEGQINSTGVNYGYYGLAVYTSSHNLEFNKSLMNAYIGNADSFGKYVRKIRLSLNGNYFSRLTMYKGNSPIPGETVVSTSGSGNTRIYDLGNDSEYFALKQTTTGEWTQITKLEIFLGSDSPVVDTVSASIKDGEYYSGNTLSASDFELTVTWTQGKADTHPTEGFTWTVNGTPNGTLNTGNNSVVVTYKGVNSY